MGLARRLKTRFQRGPVGGEMLPCSPGDLEMGDDLVLRLGAGGTAFLVEAAHADWRNEGRPDGLGPFPQYLALHRTSTGRGRVGVYWHQGNPGSVNQRGIDEMLGMIGTRGTAGRQLAFSYSISYLNTPVGTLVQTVRNMIDLAERNDVAVIIHLDGVNFWSHRPDLWNWWDPEAPGYDPENVHNVEWHDWGPEHAVKIGWRNWGRQIRVPPQANLASPAVLEAHKNKLRALVPIIRDWHDGLPEERKHLLAGVVLGWEVSPYVQSFYYENGNEYLHRDPAADPTGGSAESLPLGHAALTSLGKNHGGKITGGDIDAIVHFYLGEMVGEAHRLGLPSEKLIAHTILHPGTPSGGAHSGIGALGHEAVPGWCFYGNRLEDFDPLLDRIGGAPWAAIEIQFWGLSADLLESFFAHRNCRIVNIFNWESIRFDSDTIDVLRQVLGRSGDSQFSHQFQIRMRRPREPNELELDLGHR